MFMLSPVMLCNAVRLLGISVIYLKMAVANMNWKNGEVCDISALGRKGISIRKGNIWLTYQSDSLSSSDI